ncbi:MAG: DUF4013 domain-containing protein [Planctomycetota bacterium]
MGQDEDNPTVPPVAPAITPRPDDKSDRGTKVGPPRGWMAGALGCAFADKGWIERYWIVPVMILLPVINLIMLRGWRFELMRNLVWQRSPRLPNPADFFTFLIRGLLLWLVTLVYHLPHLAFGLLHLAQLIHAAQEGGDALIKELILIVVITVAALVVTWPLYRVAVLRYAATGSLSAFFLVPQNLWLVLRHYPRLIVMGLSVLLVTFVHVLILGGLTATLVGLVVAVLATVPIYYAATGHLYAQMASRMALTHRWFVPVEAGAEDGPRKPRPVGRVRLVVGLVVSLVLLAAGTAGGIGAALLLAGPTDSWNPETRELFDAVRSGDAAGVAESMRELVDTWSEPEAWRSLAPEWLEQQIEAWGETEDGDEAPADPPLP